MKVKGLRKPKSSENRSLRNECYPMHLACWTAQAELAMLQMFINAARRWTASVNALRCVMTVLFYEVDFNDN